MEAIDRAVPPSHVIVLGNEKGGTGKSTTALHLVVSLLRAGHAVGAVDLDARQGTLSRYITNRRAYAERHGLDLPMPLHGSLSPSGDGAAAAEAEAARLAGLLAELATRCAYIVIDTPGSDSPLGRVAHSFADTLVTPLNDSFIDLDILASVDPDTLEIRRPGIYAELVWQQRQQRARRGRRPLDWVVLRNRLSPLDARNKRDIGDILNRLARRIGFRLAPGFAERVIFRELFLKGLTLLDLRDSTAEGGLTLSHVAARQELRALVGALGLTPAGDAAAGRCTGLTSQEARAK